MSTLIERLTELMEAMNWDQPALMRESKQSSSVVSQWMGKGSKQIKTIGKMEAAIYLERASGFSALWIAKGMGPKRVPSTVPAAQPLHPLGEPETAPYGMLDLLERLGMLLAAVPSTNRAAFADVLRGWAMDAGAADRIPALIALAAPLQKRQA